MSPTLTGWRPVAVPPPRGDTLAELQGPPQQQPQHERAQEHRADDVTEPVEVLPQERGGDDQGPRSRGQPRPRSARGMQPGDDLGQDPGTAERGGGVAGRVGPAVAEDLLAVPGG